MNIDEMKAGREMDALVAEKVMGWKRFAVCDKLHPPYMEETRHTFAHGFPDYSTDITAAWEVAEKMRVAVMPIDGGGWAAKDISIDATHGTELYIIPGSDEECYGWTKADTAPLAICRAALKAVI